MATEAEILESNPALVRKIALLEDQQQCLYRIRDKVYESSVNNPLTEELYAILKEYKLVP